MEDTPNTQKSSSGKPLLLSREERASWTPGPGALAGEYILRGLIGMGGHGTVFQAEHRILGRRAAVKILHPHLSNSRDMLQRFVREAQIINKIRHPNIVSIYDFGVMRNGSPYYVMELLPSRTLSHILLTQGRLSPERILDFMDPLCAGLESAHQAGVVHRDLKTSNVAVVSEVGAPQVKLLDFGIAKIIHPDPAQSGLTIDGQRLGSPHTMAPEQIRGGAIGPATDIYALGVMLYRMLTGTYPFQSEDHMQVEGMHLKAPPPRPSAHVPVSFAVDAVVLRCMEKEPAMRYPSVTALLAALRKAVAPSGFMPSVPGKQSTLAMAVHAEAVINHDEEKDAEYSLASELLDTMEQELREAGFILAEQIGLTLLGVRLLEGRPPRKIPALLAAARELHERAQARAAGSCVRIHLCAHVGQVETRQGPEGIEIIGGPLADTSGWVVRDASGVAVTPDARRACAL